MRVTTLLLDESNLEAIAQRVYIELPEKSRKIAEAALLSANPNLAKREGFRQGVIIQIPDVPSLSLNLAQVAQDDPISQTGEVLMQVLDSYEKSLKESNKSMLADLEGQVSLIDQSNLLKALKSLEMPAAQDLKALLNKRRQENESQHKNMIAALEQAKTEIKDLFK